MRHVLRALAVVIALTLLGFAMYTAQRQARPSAALPASKSGPVYAPPLERSQSKRTQPPAPAPYVLPASKWGPVFTPPPPARQAMPGQAVP
jgi:hypothetical protein